MSNYDAWKSDSGRETAAWEREDEDDEPHCPDCGCCLYTEEHTLDCGYDDDEESEEEASA